MIDPAREEAWDRRYPSSEHDGAFIDGARWYAAGMAVCAFLSDLAVIVAESNACPVCDAGWVRPNTFGGMDRLCNTCHGTGRRP